eukprot:COSAG04_NODE_8176_length_1011_cov_1.484649_2_plen_94_part_00
MQLCQFSGGLRPKETNAEPPFRHLSAQAPARLPNALHAKRRHQHGLYVFFTVAVHLSSEAEVSFGVVNVSIGTVPETTSLWRFSLWRCPAFAI